nr:zinc finger BED domain-containing protein RICESLEEPER 2 [Tanacetum cinerariifolium]
MVMLLTKALTGGRQKHLGKKLNAKWQIGDKNEAFRNYNDNGKQHYDNRGKKLNAKWQIGDKNEAFRNYNDNGKQHYDNRDLKKEIKEAISQGKFEHPTHATKMTSNANNAPDEAACHIYMIEYFQPHNRGCNEERPKTINISRSSFIPSSDPVIITTFISNYKGRTTMHKLNMEVSSIGSVIKFLTKEGMTIFKSDYASESEFLTSERVLSIRRTRLTSASLEMCMCLKDHLDAQERKQHKSDLENPIDFEEKILDAEVQQNEAIPLSEEDIAIDVASSEGTMSGSGSRGEEVDYDTTNYGYDYE